MRVAVTGMGCVSGLGQGVADTWARAVASRGAIMPFALPRDGPARVAGPAAPAGALAMDAAEARFGRRAVAQLDPLVAFALVAAEEAVGQAAPAGDALARAAILIGCGSPGNTTLEVGYERVYGRGQTRLHPQTIPASMISAPASHLAMLFGIRGPAMAIGSACASSAHAIGEAMHLIRAGRAELVIAGGSEACLTLGSWAAWSSLGALAPDSCRPFSEGRRGMVLGEGAAMLVLEAWDRATERGAPILAELVGYAANSAATQVTVPDQAGIEAAIRAAHADAGLEPSTPVLVSAHGTGTRLNDAAEAAALHAVYGDALASSRVIATKSAHGHLIGASGALELLLGLRALREGVAPPILNHLAPDPACALPLALEPEPIAYEHVVSNSFAFGGLNAVLIGRRA